MISDVSHERASLNAHTNTGTDKRAYSRARAARTIACLIPFLRLQPMAKSSLCLSPLLICLDPSPYPNPSLSLAGKNLLLKRCLLFCVVLTTLPNRPALDRGYVQGINKKKKEKMEWDAESKSWRPRWGECQQQHVIVPAAARDCVAPCRD